MHSVFRLIAWIAIIFLAAMLAFFVLKLLTQVDPVVDQPVTAPAEESFISSSSINSDKPVSTVDPQSVEPISPIMNEDNLIIVESDKVLNEEAEDNIRKRVLEESQLRLYQLMQEPASISTQKVDDVLADMSVLKDENGLVGGVDLDALRNTLRISEEIQVLAQEIQAESELGVNANSTKLMEQSNKMEQLQYELLESSDSRKLLPGS